MVIADEEGATVDEVRVGEATHLLVGEESQCGLLFNIAGHDGPGLDPLCL
jgi:hypothetical protein